MREKWIENLYCAITNATPKVLTNERYLDSIDGLPLGESQSTILAFFLRGFSTLGEPNWDRIYRLYNLGALSEDPTCAAEFDCSDWSCNWLSGSGQGDWFIGLYGTYDSTNDRFNSTSAGSSNQDVQAKIIVPPETTLQYIKFTYVLDFGSGSGSRTQAVGWQPDGGSRSLVQSQARGSDGTYTMEYSGSLSDGTIDLYIGADGTGCFSRITAIEAYGIGDTLC